MQTITTLNDPSLITGRCLIGGSWVEAVGGASIAIENPANGENLGRVPDCGRAETEPPPRVLSAPGAARPLGSVRRGSVSYAAAPFGGVKESGWGAKDRITASRNFLK
jgi:acyl-CoA reductase-like NAD-dependent aldehyde dehydrogenase